MCIVARNLVVAIFSPSSYPEASPQLCGPKAGVGRSLGMRLQFALS